MLRRFLIVVLLGSPALATAKTTHSVNKHKISQKKAEKIKIKEVRIIGNTKISDDDLKENLVNKESSFLGFLSHQLNKKALNVDAMRIRDVYYQHGYLDAIVSKPKLTTDPASGKAIITYKIIREGAPYKVSSVRIAANRGIDKNSITKNVKLKAGETFNVETLRQDLSSISRSVGDKGYAFAKVIPRFRKNSRNKTMVVVYTVSPGRKGIINDIRITGNTKTKESVIRSYITLAPGDEYNLEDLIRAQDQLNRTGFFKNATIRPVPARNGKVDLVVNVEEDKTGSIMGAVGYDSLEGLFVEGSYSQKNIFGSGISVGVSGSYSKMKKNGTLFFDDPRVAGTQFGLYGGLFLTHTDDDNEHTYGYDKREYGGYLGIKRQFTNEISGSIDYNYNNVKYTKIYDANETYEDYIKSSIGVSVTYNNTDDFHTPRRGIYAKGRLEYAGLGSGSNFAKYLKGTLKFAAYYGLRDQIGYDLILRYKTQVRIIHSLGFVPRAEQLHIGGYYLGVRGYRSASIQPKNGGLKSWVNSIEASIPLSEKNKVRLTAFADYGMIGHSSFGEVRKKSVGAQIEWRSPMGDVNFVFAKALGAEKTDRTSTFEFTIGKQF